MTPLEALNAYIAGGTPFTYSELSAVNNAAGGKESHDRLADRTIQAWRRKGKIAYTREGRNVVWRLTEQPA